MSQPVAVYAAGVACPLGLSRRAAFAAVNASIRRYVEVDAVADLAGESARGCRLTSLKLGDPTARAVWFAAHALAETVQGLGEQVPRSLPLYLAGPAHTGRPSMLAQLERALEDTPGLQHWRWAPEPVVNEGRAGGVRALSAAIAALDRSPWVVLGGFDCQVSGQPLQALAQRNLLLGRRNCDGRLPGEGAAFVLLGRAGSLPGVEPLAIVHAVSTAREPRPFDAASPSHSLGLTEVFSALRSSWPGRVDEIVAAQSTERYFATELSTAYLRNAELMPEPMRVCQLAQPLGDCGAAAFPLGLAWGLDELDPRPWRRRSDQSVLVYSSSDDGLVGGVILATAR